MNLSVNVKKALALIRKHNRFLITSHASPDPDALCSEVALALFLRAQGKQVVIVNHDPVPQRYAFLPGMQMVACQETRQRVRYDVALVVDCGDLSRIGNVKRFFEDGKPCINFDHHITNDDFGTINVVDPHASSTAELLYEVFHSAGYAVTQDMALLLYVGIMTDTGSFRYDNTTNRTHYIVSKLLTFPFSAYKLHRQLYEEIDPQDVKEFIEIISSFKTTLQGRVAYVDLPKATIERFSDTFDVRDNIFQYLRALKGIEVVVIFTEHKPVKTRVNFRSSNDIDVARIAHHFSGGGHRKASGCLIESSMAIARRKVLQYLKEVI